MGDNQKTQRAESIEYKPHHAAFKAKLLNYGKLD